MSLYQHLKREKEVADYVSATSLFLYTDSIESRPGGRPEVRREKGKGSDVAENRDSGVRKLYSDFCIEHFCG